MLASLREVVAISKKNGRAVGAFNTPNLECLLAVLGAAEKLNVPVICSHAQLHESVAPLDTIGPVMLELAKRRRCLCACTSTTARTSNTANARSISGSPRS